MKRLTLLLFVFLSINSFAQLDVKPNSFKEVHGFVNINLEKQNDSYEKPYAVLKIRTENIDDQQRNELIFKVQDNVDYEVEYKVGEVWLYISYFATYLQVSHPELGSAEIYFPFDMVGKKGYELTLVSKPTDATGSGTIVLTTKPEDGATITLNGKTLKKQTPFTNDMIAAGHYEVTVSKSRYQSVTKSFDVYDGQTTELEIEMPLMFGKMDLQTEPAGALVFIDEKEYGITPLIINDIIVSEEHELRIEKKGCREFKTKFTLETDKTFEVKANINKCPKGALVGVFSISEKKKVHFSQGLLLSHWNYDKRSNEWKFADNQLSTTPILYENSFNWGKWQTNPSNAGLNNWKVMSDKEWNYVLFERKNPTGFLYVWADIDGKKGIILLPDDWDYKIFKLTSSNEISLADWTNILEPSGAVFLFLGEYWTSTGSENSNFDMAKTIYIQKDKVITNESFTSFREFVRLVCPAK